RLTNLSGPESVSGNIQSVVDYLGAVWIQHCGPDSQQSRATEYSHSLAAKLAALGAPADKPRNYAEEPVNEYDQDPACEHNVAVAPDQEDRNKQKQPVTRSLPVRIERSLHQVHEQHAQKLRPQVNESKRAQHRAQANEPRQQKAHTVFNHSSYSQSHKKNC